MGVIIVLLISWDAVPAVTFRMFKHYTYIAVNNINIIDAF